MIDTFFPGATAICRVGCVGQAGFKLRESVQLSLLIADPLMALNPEGFRANERHPSGQVSVLVGDTASSDVLSLVAIRDQRAIPEK
jgi:hypothetical protein